MQRGWGAHGNARSFGANKRRYQGGQGKGGKHKRKKKNRRIQEQPHLPARTECLPPPIAPDSPRDRPAAAKTRPPARISHVKRQGVPALILKQRKELPIWKVRHELVDLIERNDTVVIVGETGSGKTTQLPQYLYEFLGAKGRIGITQPRRVAAMTVARRVATELGVKLGGKVGYNIRFDDKTSPSTAIKFLTDGMLLREAMLDRSLSAYSVIILDEAHERTIHTDILFGVLKEAQQAGTKRKGGPLKLVVMSATLQADLFASYFSAPVVYVAGRQFPVDVYYMEERITDYFDLALTATLQVHMENPDGDILVFLTGQEEIINMERLLEAKKRSLPPEARGMVICPLYSALPADRQMKAFEPVQGLNVRKIVLATNIAETSVTIKGIKYVIDTGVAKVRQYNAGQGIDTLTVQPISKAAARQRTGRAGRESAGICYRLFQEKGFEDMRETEIPEIQRANLAHVVLQLKAINVKDVTQFDYMDAPSERALNRSVALLTHLGALGPSGELTPTGENMAILPLEPQFAKCLLTSKEYGCTREVLTIISMLCVDTEVFFTPRKKRLQAIEKRKTFQSAEGDHITHLSVFRGYHSAEGRARGWCDANFVNLRAVKRAVDVRKQLQEYCESMKIPESSSSDVTAIKKCLLSGFFIQVAVRTPEGMYRTLAGNKIVQIHPSSALFKKKPSCVLFNEMVFTTKKYIRDVLAIESEWLTDHAFYTNRKALR